MARKDVYDFVYNFLSTQNKSKKKYFKIDVLNNMAFKKFGESNDVEDATYEAYTSFYESPEFMKKLNWKGSG